MKNNKDKIIDIINQSGIKDASCCAFLPLLPYLLECRAKNRLPKNAKTVITCVFPYKVKENPPKNISRYAAVPDYHKVLENYLALATDNLRNAFLGYEFEWFADNSPIPEVRAAALSGLGVVGDNGLLITKEYGSFVFIGEIVTDLYVECLDELGECLHCKMCKTACPKTENTLCLSAITQKKQNLNDKELQIFLSNDYLWGCDICAEVCPLNKDKKTTYIEEFILGYRDFYEKGEDISGRAYEWRGEKVILRNFDLKNGF